MFGFIKIMFIILLTRIVNGSNNTKRLSLSNQNARFNLLLYYYSFAVKLDKCVGRCNTLNDLSNKVIKYMLQIKQSI